MVVALQLQCCGYLPILHSYALKATIFISLNYIQLVVSSGSQSSVFLNYILKMLFLEFQFQTIDFLPREKRLKVSYAHIPSTFPFSFLSQCNCLHFCQVSFCIQCLYFYEYANIIHLTHEVFYYQFFDLPWLFLESSSLS